LTRTCSIVSGPCLTNDTKPAESALCILATTNNNETLVGNETGNANETESNGFFSGITGSVIGAFGGSKMNAVLIFILAVLAAGGIIWLVRNGRKNNGNGGNSGKSRKKSLDKSSIITII
jgi:hypothetical protein